MKYIRTKDNIYDLDKYLLANATKKVFHGIITGVDCKDIEIIKQAYTIEELCDEFVYISKNSKYSRLIQFIFLPEYKDKHNIYGAIWTDKGLIYVARMNDKGELELL